MKRKRGHKKGKTKGTTNPAIATNAEFENKEQNSPFDEFGYDNKDNNSGGMEGHTPSSTGTYHNYSPAPPVGRVKVKLRTPKVLDSQPTSSDAHTHSDTDKSSQQHGFDKHAGNADRLEDSVSSLCAPSKRPGSIKIKSSKMLGSNADLTGTPLSACSEISHQKERKNSPYNKQELDASLAIIRKIMKMDAAEPFNVPVNPDALGIPDYFNIIDTPMDFGTICRRLEKNEKYMNSEDVFKDVQYIWDNCYKYNNKGDYILDLMRRVKKNFMKYWTSVGLYTEPSKGTKERTTSDDIALSGDGKVRKQKTKKRHGRHHKHDCLCAICVLKRRRREREENARIAKGNFGTGGDMHTKEFKQEEPMLVVSPGEEDSSSNMDESMGTDGDGEADKGDMVKMDISEKQHSPSEGKHGNIDVDDDDDDDDIEDDRDQEEEEDGEEDEEDIEMDSQKREMDESLQQSQHGRILVDKSNVGDANVLHDEYTTTQQGQATAVSQQKHKEAQGKHQRAKLFKSLYIENPKLASLCGILFPKNSDSVWSGAHSLIQQHRDSARTSSIHAAIASFME